jgi:hypothetical protein
MVAASSHRMVLSCVVPLVVGPLRCLPALRLLPGQTPAQEARWAALGNRPRSPGADLRQDGGCGHRSRHWQREQQVDGLLVFSHQVGDLPLASRDAALQVRDVVQDVAQELPMVRLHPPVQGQEAPGRELLTPPPSGQLSQGSWIRLPRRDGPQQAASTDAHHVAGHRAQFEIGRLQDFVQTIDRLRAQLDERLALAREIAQDADGRRRDEAGAQQARGAASPWRSKPVAQQARGAASPWRSRSASHSLSLTSVLRPGTALRCCALTRRSVRPCSSTLKRGRQSTPVRSMATCVTAWYSSQSPSASRAAVLVPKVRTNRWLLPSGSVSSTHATTIVFCWMSKPHQRGDSTCIPSCSSSSLGQPASGAKGTTRCACVLTSRRRGDSHPYGDAPGSAA